MTLEQISLLAEIIGTGAIVLSLIFVGFQVKEGSRQTRTTASQLAVQSEMSMAIALADHAGTWEKVVTDAPLAPGEETRRAIVLYNIYMLDTANRFQQFKSGYLDARLWQGRLAILESTVKLAIFEKWRNSPGGRNQAVDFLELVDSLLSA